MSRALGSDWTLRDIAERVCPAFRLTPSQVLDVEALFPKPDYHVNLTAYWRPQSMVPWIEARAQSEVVSREGELRELVAIERAMARIKGESPPPDDVLRLRALRHYAEAKLRQVFDGASPYAPNEHPRGH